jgi:hypothetical protein
MINSVRNTVLSVLNKNNYGYISPSDFNLFAQQAQMELYEEYYSNYNKIINLENRRMAGSDYANLSKPIAEVIEYFLVSDFLIPIFYSSGNLSNQFEIPSNVTTGNFGFMFSRVSYYNEKRYDGVNDSVSAFELIDSTANFFTIGVLPGDIIVNTTTFTNAIVEDILTADTLALSSDIFPINTGEGYAIYSATNISEAEKVTDGNIFRLNTSLLTAPSQMFPAYTLSANALVPHPQRQAEYGNVRAIYFRYPKNPKWTYISLAGGEPVFDQTQVDYQDFELPLEDEFKLVMKILQYCGISIRETQVVQYSMSQEQQQKSALNQQQ